MAYCPKCGASIDEGTKEAFCGSCGYKFENVEVQAEQPVEAQAEAQAETQAEQPAEQNLQDAANAMIDKGMDVANDVIDKVKSGNKKTIGILAGAAAAVVIVAVLVATLLLGGKMDPINKYVKAINKNEDSYLKLSAITAGKYGKMRNEIQELYIKSDAEYWGDMTYADVYEEYDESLKDLYDEIKDEYGKFKVTFKKSKAKSVKVKDFEEDFGEWEDIAENCEDRVDDLKDLLKDEDDLEEWADDQDISVKDAKKIIKAQIEFFQKMSKTKLTKVYEIKGKFIVKADGEEYKSETVSLFVGKIGGEWVFLGSEDYIEFEDDEEGYLDDLFDCFDEFM